MPVIPRATTWSTSTAENSGTGPSSTSWSTSVTTKPKKGDTEPSNWTWDPVRQQYYLIARRDGNLGQRAHRAATAYLDAIGTSTDSYETTAYLARAWTISKRYKLPGLEDRAFDEIEHHLPAAGSEGPGVYMPLLAIMCRPPTNKARQGALRSLVVPARRRTYFGRSGERMVPSAQPTIGTHPVRGARRCAGRGGGAATRWWWREGQGRSLPRRGFRGRRRGRPRTRAGRRHR